LNTSSEGRPGIGLALPFIERVDDFEIRICRARDTDEQPPRTEQAGGQEGHARLEKKEKP